jgi:hypothetical protein
VTRYIIDSVGALSSVIRRKAPKTRSVGTKPSGLVVLLTAFTAIYKHASLGVIKHFFSIILKARRSKACACSTRLID